MKKYLILLIGLFLFIPESIQAQYRQYKHYYAPYEYIYHYDDRYNPGLCGVASFAVPGLGQIIAGESRRGVAFMSGAAVTYICTYTGALMIQGSDSYHNSIFRTGTILFLGGLAGLVTINIWSTVDAVRVAKVNNLAIRDLRKTSFNMRPSLQVGTGNTIIPGLALSLGF